VTGALVLLVGLPIACCAGAAGPVRRWWSGVSLPGKPATTSVAVLPFGTGGVWGDTPEDKVGEEVAAEVTRLLSQSSGLKVTPHSSALKHRSSSPSMASRFLEVRWVVAGKVTRQAQGLDLRVEVIDAQDDRVVQTRTFTLPAGKDRARSERVAAEIAALVRQAIEGR
jgi:TolB-like protein